MAREPETPSPCRCPNCPVYPRLVSGPSSCTVRRTPRIKSSTFFFWDIGAVTVHHLDPTAVIFKKISVTEWHNVRQCDPSLPFNSRDDRLQVICALLRHLLHGALALNVSLSRLVVAPLQLYHLPKIEHKLRRVVRPPDPPSSHSAPA